MRVSLIGVPADLQADRHQPALAGKEKRMGGGHDNNKDRPRRTSNLALATGDFEMGQEDDAGAETDACAAIRTVTFKNRGYEAIQEGIPVSIAVADPPLVVNDAGNILGYLTDPGARQVAACLTRGWSFQGEISSVTSSGGTATISGTE